jgi:hypothetical protein
MSVETEVEDSEAQSASHSVKLNLGPWNYVSLLNERELKHWVRRVYQGQCFPSPETTPPILSGGREPTHDGEGPRRSSF